MNYLAHIALSGPQPDHRIGGFLGDFVRGPLRGELPYGIEQGIYLHRKIDVFVDRQPEIYRFISSFKPPWRRYAGIIADVLYDHFLARDWEHYYSLPLGDYCQQFYVDLEDYALPLPPRAQLFQQRAAAIGWLESYRLLDNVPLILHRIGQRFRQPVELGLALNQSSEQLSLWSDEFHRVYPRLIAHAEKIRSQAEFDAIGSSENDCSF